MSRQSDLFWPFYNDHIGRAIDIDGVAGVQCVDLAKMWLAEVGFPDPYKALGGDGYAHQYYYRRDALGLTSFFNVVYSGFAPGDLLIYKEYPGYTPLSHVGLCYEDLGNGWHKCFGQNQGGYNGAANVIELPNDALLCGFRLKEEPQWSPDGQCLPGAHVKCSTDYVEKIDFKNNTVYLRLMQAWIPIDLLGFGEMKVSAKNCWVSKADFSTIDGKIGVGPTNARQGVGDWKISNSNLKVSQINMKEKKLYFSDVASWLPWSIVGTEDFKISGNCWMSECEVEDVDVASNRIKVHGLWVNPAPFLVKV